MANELANRLGRRAERVRGPLSLVEIDLSENDEKELAGWARSIGPAAVRSPRDFGLLFLANATVIARREARGHHLWPYIFGSFGDSGRRSFFDINKQPRAEVLDCMTEAASAYGLRHVIDRGEGEQRWYVTTMLQCGWSRWTLQNLPEWLAGRPPPRALQLLLFDPELRSNQLVRDFEALREFRRGRCDTVEMSPWLSGDLKPTAERHARQRGDLGTAGEASGSSFASVTLVAGKTGLSFRVDMAPALTSEDVAGEQGGEAGAERPDPHIDFTWAGFQTRAILQQGGSYSAPPAIMIPLADVPARGCIDVAVTSARRSLALEVPLFSANDDVDVFVGGSEGRFTRQDDPWNANLGLASRALVRYADDLTMTPPPAEPPVRAAGSCWQVVQRSEMDHVRVPITAEDWWDFRPDGIGRTRWQGTVELRLADTGTWEPDAPISWQYSLGRQSARLVAARVGRADLTIHASTEGRGLLVRSAAGWLPRSFELRATVEDAEHRYFIHAPLPPPRCLSLLVANDEGLVPQPVKSWASLDGPVRFCWSPLADATEHADVPWLFEGGSPVDPLTQRPTHLRGRLAGIGAPLTIRDRTFNGSRIARLSASLFNAGIIRKVESAPEFTHLHWTAPREWDAEKHMIEVMWSDGQIKVVDPQLMIVGPDRVSFMADDAPVAGVVRYGREQIGRFVDENLARVVAQVSHLKASAWVPWLVRQEMPVAGPEGIKTAVGMLIRHRPLDLLGTLLEPDCRDTQAVHAMWREFLIDAVPALDAALAAGPADDTGLARLLGADSNPKFGANDDRFMIVKVYERLAGSDPLSAARTLRAYACQRTVFNRAGVWEGGWTELRDTIHSVDLSGLARGLGIDAGFVESHAKRAVMWALADRFDPGADGSRANISALFCYRDFRRRVAADVVRQCLTLLRIR